MAIDESFGELHQRVVEILLGVALLEVLVEEEEISKLAMIKMIQSLHCDELDDMAVQLSIDVLRLGFD